LASGTPLKPAQRDANKPDQPGQPDAKDADQSRLVLHEGATFPKKAAAGQPFTFRARNTRRGIIHLLDVIGNSKT